MPELDAAAIVRALNQHGVRYVIIGGIAARIHGLAVPATIDIVAARDHENLERASAHSTSSSSRTAPRRDTRNSSRQPDEQRWSISR